MSSEKLVEKARKLHNDSIVSFKGKPVGTRASFLKGSEEPNYDRVYIRDFAVSAVAFLLDGQNEIVKNFLWETSLLQNRSENLDGYEPGKGMIPGSFKITQNDKIIPDYGERSIGKVPSADSGLWWLYILRMYMKATGDKEFISKKEIQETAVLVLELCLKVRFDIFPTLLVPDGSFMIDRRMGVYGYPLEIQTLFFTALVSAKEVLEEADGDKDFINLIERRLGHLVYHLGGYYWIDFKRLNDFYNCKKQKNHTIERFNIYPSSIPSWVYTWLPESGGYFAGNLGPGRIDLRFFTGGNLLAIISSLASHEQSIKIIDLIESHKDIFFGKMPLKILYPALNETEWKILTGHDEKNIPWSYHNGGSWPFMIWYFAAVTIKYGREDLLNEALEILENRIDEDEWPEYYDGEFNQLIGRETRKFQTWSIAGYLVANHLRKNPDKLNIINFEEKQEAVEFAKQFSQQIEKNK